MDESGRVLRDNVWGPMNEDATRRDFTVNAMYYDPTTQVVIDFHGGLSWWCRLWRLDALTFLRNIKLWFFA